MKDEDDHRSISRRTFLTLSAVLAWAFQDRHGTQLPFLVAMSQEQKNRKEHFLAQKKPRT